MRRNSVDSPTATRIGFAAMPVSTVGPGEEGVGGGGSNKLVSTSDGTSGGGGGVGASGGAGSSVLILPSTRESYTISRGSFKEGTPRSTIRIVPSRVVGCRRTNSVVCDTVAFKTLARHEFMVCRRLWCSAGRRGGGGGGGEGSRVAFTPAVTSANGPGGGAAGMGGEGGGGGALSEATTSCRSVLVSIGSEYFFTTYVEYVEFIVTSW